MRSIFALLRRRWEIDPANWTDLVPHKAGCLIRAVVLFGNWLVRLEREEALPRIVVQSLTAGAEYNIAFDEEAYDLSLMPGYEYETIFCGFLIPRRPRRPGYSITICAPRPVPAKASPVRP